MKEKYIYTMERNWLPYPWGRISIDTPPPPVVPVLFSPGGLPVKPVRPELRHAASDYFNFAAVAVGEQPVTMVPRPPSPPRVAFPAWNIPTNPANYVYSSRPSLFSTSPSAASSIAPTSLTVTSSQSQSQSPDTPPLSFDFGTDSLSSSFSSSTSLEYLHDQYVDKMMEFIVGNESSDELQSFVTETGQVGHAKTVHTEKGPFTPSAHAEDVILDTVDDVEYGHRTSTALDEISLGPKKNDFHSLLEPAYQAPMNSKEPVTLTTELPLRQSATRSARLQTNLPYADGNLDEVLLSDTVSQEYIAPSRDVIVVDVEKGKQDKHDVKIIKTRSSRIVATSQSSKTRAAPLITINKASKQLGRTPADEAFATSLDQLVDVAPDQKPPYLWWTLIRAAVLGQPDGRIQMETLCQQVSAKYP